MLRLQNVICEDKFIFCVSMQSEKANHTAEKKYTYRSNIEHEMELLKKKFGRCYKNRHF